MNETEDGPYRVFGISDPINLATWNWRQLLQFYKFLTGMSIHRLGKAQFGTLKLTASRKTSGNGPNHAVRFVTRNYVSVETGSMTLAF